MKQQDALQFLSFELELPGEYPGGYHRYCRNCGHEEVVVSRGRQGGFSCHLSAQIKRHGGYEQSNRKMDQDDVLGVLGQQHSLWVEGICHDASVTAPRLCRSS